MTKRRTFLLVLVPANIFLQKALVTIIVEP